MSETNVPPDLLGWSIEEYRDVPCGRCGNTERTLHANVTADGYAMTAIECDRCGLQQSFEGRIPQSRV